MRGKLSGAGCGAYAARNIPAYAGKTAEMATEPQSAAEHPRVCGENVGNVGKPLTGIGTSPRMRGKLPVLMHELPSPRNIPAYAGKTATSGTVSTPATEHPRVCGENQSIAAAHRAAHGTSPRMRGKPPINVHGFDPRRNIPAYAGKTLTILILILVVREHPRVCGENPPGKS